MASTLKHPFVVFITRCGDGDYRNDEVATFRFEQEEIPSWEDMKAVVKAQYDISLPIVLKYIDSDQEEVTIGSQEEWHLAVQAAEKDSNNLILRFAVVPAHKSPKQQAKPNKPPKVQRPAAAPRCKKEHITSHLQNINSKVDNLSKELSTVKLNQQHQLEEFRRQASTTSQSSLHRASVTHEGVLCGACRRVILGARFKCANCTDFNLCAVCEKQLPGATHPRNHVFLKILIPMDREVDALLTVRPVVGFDFYKKRSVEEFVKRERHLRQRRKRRSRSSSSSSSSNSNSSSSSSSSGSDASRCHRRSKKSSRHSRFGSSVGSNSHACRYKRHGRRHRSPSSGSSSGSEQRSGSPSIVTVDLCSSKRRRCSESCSASACDRKRHHFPHCRRHHGLRGHHGHRHGHRPHRRHEEEEQRRLMDWASGHAAPADTEKEVGAENVMMSDNEMSRFRHRLRQLADSSPEDQLEAEVLTEDVPEPVPAEYYVQTGCGLGEWVTLNGDTSERPTSDFTLLEDAETVLHVESTVKEDLKEKEEMQLITEEDLKEKEDDEVQLIAEEGLKDKDEEKELNKSQTETTAVVPLIDLDADDGERSETTPQPEPAAEAPETASAPAESKTSGPSYPFPKPLSVQYPPLPENQYPQQQPPWGYPMQQQQQQQQQQHHQYAQCMYQPYPIATNVPVPASVPAAAPAAAPALATDATADAAPAPAPAPALNPNPIYPYPNYPVNGAAQANLWTAAVNATNGLLQQIQAGWAGQPPSNYQYNTDREMQQLLEMGFCNRELNRSLLEKHNNNVQAVVSELISKTNDDWYATRH